MCRFCSKQTVSNPILAKINFLQDFVKEVMKNLKYIVQCHFYRSKNSQMAISRINGQICQIFESLLFEQRYVIMVDQ